METLRDLPAVTGDGVRVEILGNIEFDYEVDHCLDRGADGIGLYRTEFLYLGADEEPDEECHFQAYSRVVKTMGERPVIIRTFDMGADKVPHLPPPEDERNPFLGLRSIRLALRNVPMFRTQLRAILRASALGHVKVMFPLVSTLLELRQAKMVLADVIEDLEEHGVSYRQEPAGGDDGRGARRGDDDRPLRRGGRLLQHRHQRPDPVHAGRGPQQQGRGGAVQRLRPGRAEADPIDHRRGAAAADCR